MTRTKIYFDSDVICYCDADDKRLLTNSSDSVNIKDINWDYIVNKWKKTTSSYSQNVASGTQVFGKTLCEILNLKEKELNGENEEEEKDMNKVLELYKERKVKEIIRKYKELVEKELESNTFINKYNALVADFKKNLEDLEVEEQKENAGKFRVLVRTGYDMELPIEINDDYRCYIVSKPFDIEKDKEMHNLYSTIDEINAMLSMSDDKDYQIEVLQRYGIIDKKGKMSE